MIIFLHALSFFFFLFLSKSSIRDFWCYFCIGYTLFANTLNLCVYIFRNKGKNKWLVTVKVFAVCLLGWKINRAKVVILTCHMPTWLDICPFQKLSRHLKQNGSYGLHKSSASGKISTWWINWEYSWTWHAYWSLPNIIKIFQTTYTINWLRN